MKLLAARQFFFETRELALREKVREIRGEVTVIAAKGFVAPLPVERHLHADVGRRLDEFEHTPLGVDARASERLFVMPKEIVEFV